MTDQRPCPECGGETSSWPGCHTWPQRPDDGTEQWMSCLPCDTAVDYYCTEDDCRWTYTAGLNPGNPRAAENERHRPPWLVAS